MKILVTGGAGYLGGVLSQRLIDLGHTVRILDLVETKYLPPSAEFIKGDIRNVAVVRSAMMEVEIIFHLAFVQTPSDLPEEIQYQVNVQGTRQLLEEATKHKIKRFIFVSTIEVYGSKPKIPISEENQLDPVGIYSVHKIMCEEMCLQYLNEYGLPCAIGRFPVICGKGYYNHKPFLTMLNRILNNKDVFLPYPGTTIADMIHISDAIDALLLLSNHDNAIGQIFHFTASKPANHLEMARAAIAITGSKSSIVFIPKWLVRMLGHLMLATKIYTFPREQINYLLYDFVCSNTKAEKNLGYKPRYSVIDAIGELIRGYSDDQEYIMARKIGSNL